MPAPESVDFGSAPPSPSPRLRSDNSWIKTDPDIIMNSSDAENSQLATPSGPPVALGPREQSPRNVATGQPITVDEIPPLDPLNKPADPRLAQEAAQRPRRRRDRSPNTDNMDIYDDLRADPPLPPASLPISSTPDFGEHSPCLSVIFENLVDHLDFHIQDLSSVFRDSIVASNPTTVFLDQSYASTKTLLIKYARPRRFYVKCYERRNCFELVAMRPKKVKLKPRMAQPVSTSPPRTSAPPTSTSAPRTPPSAPPTHPTPAPPRYPPPVQNNPSYKKPLSYVELASRRAASRAGHTSSSSVAATRTLPPPPPPPPPPPATPALKKVSAATAMITKKIQSSIHDKRDAAAGRAWAEKRARAVPKVAPWRDTNSQSKNIKNEQNRVDQNPPASAATSSSASSSTDLNVRVAKIRSAFNSILDAL